jgi:sialic acid synthase SpsE
MIWVAEIGSAHNGSKAQAFEMIRQASCSGATIAKFQFGWLPQIQVKYAGSANEIRYIDHWAQDLADWCDHFDIELMASIWSFEGLEVARSIGMKRFKIAHQMNDEALIGEMLTDEKEIFSSNKNLYHRLVKRIWCTEGYPSYNPDWGCDRDGFDSFYGYSSHAHGYADALTSH